MIRAPGTPAAFPVLMGSVTLTPAQILALFTTAIQVVPAPGAGFVLLPIATAANYTFKTTAYTDGGGTPGLTFRYSAGGLQAANIGTTVAFWDQTHSTFMANGNMQRAPAALSSIVNAPLLIQAGANPTLGDGTVTVAVWYSVMAVA